MSSSTISPQQSSGAGAGAGAGPPEGASERELAMERLKKKRDFQGHLVAYVVINAALWALWAATDAGGYPWPAWVTGLWGIGLVMNWWEVYMRRPITEDDVQREIERLHTPR